MRDKFSELIAQGVASFNYTNIASELPEQDPVCRMYNNIWSIPSDTHMHYNNETGERYITGHMINTDKWSKFIYAYTWGAVQFKTTGYWCLCDFLQKNGLCGHIDTLNGDIIYKIVPCSSTEFTVPECPVNCITSESRIPISISNITFNGDVMKVYECYHDKESIYDICNALNENIYIKGHDWTVVDGKIMCPIGNKIIIL